MIGSYEELGQSLQKLDLGEPKFKISIQSHSIRLHVEACDTKAKLGNSGYWLDGIIAYNIERYFNLETKKLCLKNDILHKINYNICEALMNMIEACSDSKMSHRTSLYKEYKTICMGHRHDPLFLTDIISILNYYYPNQTDTTCKSNVIGLLQIDRKSVV